MAKYENKDELREAVKKALMEKGIDEDTASYLAELYANSPAGENQLSENPVPGGCSFPGFFPGS